MKLRLLCRLCWHGHRPSRRFHMDRGVMLHTGGCTTGYRIAASLEHFNCHRNCPEHTEIQDALPFASTGGTP